MTRVAMVITGLQMGGAERCFVELATRLDRTKYQPVVYSLQPTPQPEQMALVEQLQRAGITVHFLNARTLWSFLRVLFALCRHFRRQRPELAQAFLFHANFVTSLAARLCGVPVVLTGVRVAEPRRWHLRLAHWTERFVTRHVCVSQSVADYSRNVGNLSADKLVVIPNGVDIERFGSALPIDLQRMGIAKGRRVITFVGRLDAQKGLGWLLHLASRIFARFDALDLLIVGHGPDREMLERATATLGIDSRVRFVGWRDDVPRILAASDVLVLPSEWEGMPNVILEAMASGKPVVATEVEGVAELLGPLKTPQIAHPGDSNAFLERVFAILENAGFAADLGQKNRDRARSEFSLTKMADAYDRLYTLLLQA